VRPPPSSFVTSTRTPALPGFGVYGFRERSNLVSCTLAVHGGWFDTFDPSIERVQLTRRLARISATGRRYSSFERVQMSRGLASADAHSIGGQAMSPTK
jgi:hypothetical protein